MKKNKPYKVSIITLTIILLFFLIPSILFLNSSLYAKNNCTKTEAEITQIIYYHDNYEVFVTFDYQGSPIEKRIGEYSSSWYGGKKITIYYNEDLSRIYSYISVETFPIIFLSLSGIIFIADGICVVLSIKKKKKEKWLKENGQKIYAKISNVIVNYNVSYNGVHPATFECCYKKGAEIITFTKKIVQRDYINLTNKKVAIYYNAENMKEYIVDLEDIVDDNDANYNSDDFNYNQDYSYEDRKGDYNKKDDYNY